jgi:hypothetical protein
MDTPHFDFSSRRHFGSSKSFLPNCDENGRMMKVVGDKGAQGHILRALALPFKYSRRAQPQGRNCLGNPGQFRRALGG